LIGWKLTALSVQNKLQGAFKKYVAVQKVDMRRNMKLLRIRNTRNATITMKKLFSLRVFVGEALQHERYHQSKSSQPITWLTY